MSRLGLQAVLVVTAAILMITGAMGFVGGIDESFYGIPMSHVQGNAILDSNMRFYSGLSIGIGAILLCIAPTIERWGLIVVMLSIQILIGGLGRVAGMVMFDVPSIPFVLFTIAELAFPVLILWQRRVAADRPGSLSAELERRLTSPSR